MARLLRADLTALEDESLDHIARRMRDITRRLDLGRAGPKTLAVQDAAERFGNEVRLTLQFRHPHLVRPR